jgi:hypothetical protein
VLEEMDDIEARCQSVESDLAKKSPEYADIDGPELAALLGGTLGGAGGRIHLCAIDEYETAQWLEGKLSHSEGDGSELL